VMQLLPAAA
jgi:hypothetical protein